MAKEVFELIDENGEKLRMLLGVTGDDILNDFEPHPWQEITKVDMREGKITHRVECAMMFIGESVVISTFHKEVLIHKLRHTHCNMTVEKLAENVATAFSKIFNDKELAAEFGDFIEGNLLKSMEHHQTNTPGCAPGNCDKDCEVGLEAILRIANKKFDTIFEKFREEDLEG